MILIADSPYAELSSTTVVNFYILVVERGQKMMSTGNLTTPNV